MKLKTLYFFCIFLTTTSILPQVDLGNGLIAYYPFNGNANDESGHYNNGTVYGGSLTTDRFGNPNSAYEFLSGQYLTLPNNSDFDFTNEMSISLWIAPNYPDGSYNEYWMYPIRKGTQEAASDWSWGIYFNIVTKMYGLILKTEDGITTEIDRDMSEIPENSYSHIVLVYDGNKLRLYKNGILIESVSKTGIVHNNPNADISTVYTNIWYYQGKLDDMRFYNRALTDEEIQELYNTSQITTWYALGQGGNSNTDFITSIDIAPNSNIYLVGKFTEMVNSNGTVASLLGVARFDGSEYHSIGKGVEGGYPETVMVLPNGNIAVGGNWEYGALNNDNSIVHYTAYFAIWNSASNKWDSVGIFDAPVYDLELDGDYLLIAGEFEEVWNLEGGSSIPNSAGIIKLNLNTMQLETLTDCKIPVDKSNKKGPKTILSIGNNEYIVGTNYNLNVKDPTDVEIPYTKYLYRLKGIDECYSLKHGVDGPVFTLEKGNDFYKNHVYIGGSFEHFYEGDGTERFSPAFCGYEFASNNEYIYSFEGVFEIGDTVFTINYSSEQLYFGGKFKRIVNPNNTVKLNDIDNIVKYSISENEWKKLTYNQPDAKVKSLNYDNGKMYVGGYFYSVGGIENSKCIASFTDSENSLVKLISNLSLNIRVFLEGPYTSNTMSTNLTGSNAFPKSQPYNKEPWNYYGTESVTSVPVNVVDWVLVELRSDANTPSNIKRAGFIKNDGWIVDTDGSSQLTFEGVADGNYYIVVYHRNHLSIMSSSAQSLNTDQTNNQVAKLKSKKVKELIRENKNGFYKNPKIKMN